ncbi:MAG TPA: hypothetical protein VGI47_08055 [Candidatus Binataceae bacterium]
MFAALAALVGTLIAVNYLVNPFGAWRISVIDPIFRSLDQYRVVTPYIVRTSHPDTLLVGNSRVVLGMEIKQVCRDGFLNGAFMGGRIAENAKLIELALKNPALKRIVWQIDFVSFDKTLDGFADGDTEDRLCHPWRTIVPDTLLSVDALNESWRELRRARAGRSSLWPEQVAPMPWPPELIKRAIEVAPGTRLDMLPVATLEDHVRVIVDFYREYSLSAAALDLAAATVREARARGVEVILYTPPLNEYELEGIRQTGNWELLKRWKRQILKLGPYSDFSGYNPVARLDFLFTDIRHYKPAIGFPILRNVIGLSCSGCGLVAESVNASPLPMTASDSERTLAIQDARMKAAAAVPSRYSKMVAEMIAATGNETASK